MEAWIKWEVSNTSSTLTPRESVFWMFGSNCLISSTIISGFPVDVENNPKCTAVLPCNIALVSMVIGYGT